ncbi:Hypothetical protein R9X50_00265100 [Acrodontium crateriforme]|uniref:DhaL domain-containing protein n=1 Tax=Acrodontium crateriforme TaxID=150365 RepID=A0AAQ3M1A9_9PEZI|nr:Hypothetical protein R9X50_00265100 [Acrodontium crateriforme]
MSIIVEQTLPFPRQSLNLRNPSRWNSLFPLLRSSMKAIPIPSGATVLVDETLAQGPKVKVVAVGRGGQISSQVLKEKSVAAIMLEGDSWTKADELVCGILAAGVQRENGIVVVRRGRQRGLEGNEMKVVVVETEDEVMQDHVLHLLGCATDSCRASLPQMMELLRQVLDRSRTVYSSFCHEKEDGHPAMLHGDGVQGFEKARHAVECDLKNAMKGSWSTFGEVVYSVHFSDVNGLSQLENYIVAGEIARYLESQNIAYSLSHSTVLNHAEAARGFSISICPISSQFLTAQPRPQTHQSAAQADENLSRKLSPITAKMSFDDAQVRQRIQNGCEAVIKAEPLITEYDTIVGDGDCGYTLRDGAKQVLSFIADQDLSRLPETVAALVHDLEVNMGGTSGALYCIYLTALAGALATETSMARALHVALNQLLKYTRARLGDRTMMDALIPFVHVFETTGNVDQAIAEAKKGVEGTKTMEAKLGRSTYLDESSTQGVPDPGAYGLLVLLQGIAKG